MTMLRYFATAARGLEEVLARELIALNLSGVKTTKGGVAFSGRRSDGYRACLWLRTANRVLQPIAEFDCPDSDELYASVAAIGWEDYLTPDMTLAVDGNLRDSTLTHSRFIALKTKDAIVDRLRERVGRRPDIDPRTPDLRINVHLARNHCTVSLDLAGYGLHRRGYRQDPSLAPLRETLAAGIIALSEWDPETAFADPMCGSGTLPLEAALAASRTAPGLIDPTFGFCKWPDFDASVWHAAIEEAESLCRSLPESLILGADRDHRALKHARRNAERLPMGDLIHWQAVDFANLQAPSQTGTLICNPPYGERLGDQEKLAPFYKRIGDTLKQHWTGWTAWVFTGNLDLAKRIGLRPSRRIVLYNGAIECRLLKFELY
jgi:putative N6-adenine-specific DNA methylase